jgi:shikimate dehydrogenase
MDFGVIGAPIAHSKSPQLFAEFWAEHPWRDQLSYEKFLVEPADLQRFMSETLWSGFNVTVPLKTAILPLLAGLTPEAQAVGAVNTVVRTEAGWVGHNTDADGFWEVIAPYPRLDALKKLPVCVLGNGGAARAVVQALHRRGFKGQIGCRSPKGAFPWPELPFEQLLAPQFGLVVQCTSLGMDPHPGILPPLPYWTEAPPELAVDLVYTPANTLFLQSMAVVGTETISGEGMLRFQAKKAWQYWAEVLNIPHI